MNFLNPFVCSVLCSLLFFLLSSDYLNITGLTTSMVHILDLKGRLSLTNSRGGIDLLHKCVVEAQEVVTFSILQLIIGILSGSMHPFITALAILGAPDQEVLLRAVDILCPQAKHLQNLLVLQDLITA